MELFDKPVDAYKEQYTSLVLQQWDTCVNMANSISERRMTSNNFFITICAGLFTINSFLLDYKCLLLTIGGIFTCILWIATINNYKALNSEKFRIITELETILPVSPYTVEWNTLKKNKKYSSFSKLEKALPIIFIVLFIASILYPVIVSICSTQPSSGGVA